MKLGELYSKPLQEVLQELELVDMKVHTDDSGEVKAVELKYEENNIEKNIEKKKEPMW